MRKTFLKKGFLVAILLFFVAANTFPASAQFFSFSRILSSFFGGGAHDSQDSVPEGTTLAAASFPLLGSVLTISPIAADGVGGPPEVESGMPTLPVVQESALVASHNPAGTLPSQYSGQILVYTVQPDDVPSLIAENFGISLNTLLWANNIRNPNLIKVGDELIILPVTGVQYEIKKGDTISSIAKEFKGDGGEILSFNGLAVGEPLQIGAVIIIPDGERAPIPVPSSSSSGSRYTGLPTYEGYYLRPILGGRRSRGIHGYNGVDLAQACGRPVLASAEGSVIIARHNGWNGGYGVYLVIKHPNGTQTLYSHLTSIVAVVGQYVAQGSQIGTVGSTGNSTGCHVHFEVRGARNPF